MNGWIPPRIAADSEYRSVDTIHTWVRRGRVAARRDPDGAKVWWPDVLAASIAAERRAPRRRVIA